MKTLLRFTASLCSIYLLLLVLSDLSSAGASRDGRQQPLDILTPSSEMFLNVTAILSSPAPPHHAFIRCLRSPRPFVKYPTIGSSLLLSNSSNITLVTLPASPRGEAEGWHNPPHAMWFVLLSGRARVWTPGLPKGSHDEVDAVESASQAAGDTEAHGDVAGQEVWINAEPNGKNQLVLALDVVGRGHKTWYYGEEGSDVRALQVPFGEGWEEDIGKWETVHDGACGDQSDHGHVQRLLGLKEQF